MAQNTAVQGAAAPVHPLQPGRWERIWRNKSFRMFRRNKAAVAGSIILVTMGIIATLAPVIAPYDPLLVNTSNVRSAPSLDHFFGTDELGRDVMSRVMWGARLSLPVGFFAVAGAALVGTTLGLTAGFFEGWVGMVIMRIIDIMMAFPGILLATTIVALLGAGLQNLMIAVGIGSVPLYTRVIRGSTLAVKENLYIDAARSLGATNKRIMFRHIFPNVVAPLIVLMTIGVSFAILIAASLSFLGLGVQPPTPEWGSMISSARQFFRLAPWMALFPGFAITLVVLSLNMVGDALRDILDPRLRT